jgi:hypothetical protein
MAVLLTRALRDRVFVPTEAEQSCLSAPVVRKYADVLAMMQTYINVPLRVLTLLNRIALRVQARDEAVVSRETREQARTKRRLESASASSVTSSSTPSTTVNSTNANSSSIGEDVINNNNNNNSNTAAQLADDDCSEHKDEVIVDLRKRLRHAQYTIKTLQEYGLSLYNELEAARSIADMKQGREATTTASSSSDYLHVSSPPPPLDVDLSLFDFSSSSGAASPSATESDTAATIASAAARFFGV